MPQPPSECICGGNPQEYEGPRRDCPMHGEEEPKKSAVVEMPIPKKFCAFCHRQEGACAFLFNGRTPNIHICDVCVGDSVTTLHKAYRAAPKAEERLRYRYHWLAQYDDGTFFPQFDREQVERSVGRLDWGRVVRFDLMPKLAGFPAVEVRIDQNKGERGIKFWQVTKEAQEGKLEDLREVVGLKIDPAVQGKKHVQVYVMLCADGRIIVTSEPNC